MCVLVFWVLVTEDPEAEPCEPTCVTTLQPGSSTKEGGNSNCKLTYIATPRVA